MRLCERWAHTRGSAGDARTVGANKGDSGCVRPGRLRLGESACACVLGVCKEKTALVHSDSPERAPRTDAPGKQGDDATMPPARPPRQPASSVAAILNRAQDTASAAAHVKLAPLLWAHLAAKGPDAFWEELVVCVDYLLTIPTVRMGHATQTRTGAVLGGLRNACVRVRVRATEGAASAATSAVSPACARACGRERPAPPPPRRHPHMAPCPRPPPAPNIDSPPI